MTRVWIAIACAALATGCSQSSQPLAVRNLDRPTEVAFACYGDYQIVDPESGLPQGDPGVSAQPLVDCVDPPLAQQGVPNPPGLFAFVLQNSRGTVAIVQGAGSATADLPFVLDSDPLTPGKNAIPIATLPVGLTGDRSGCFMLSASAATGELAALEVTSALDAAHGGATSARIDRVPIADKKDTPVPGSPRTLVGGAQTATIGEECPRKATGQVYVAYPSCHMVAVVDAETGVIQAGLQFAADGTATVTDGTVASLACDDESTDPVGDVPKPVALFTGSDGRLYVGSENSPIVTMVELDPETGLPVPEGVTSVQLEGAVGVTSLAVSEDVVNGGENGMAGGGGGTSRYLYAVATDRTVRVVDVLKMQECDTQVDPRFIHELPLELSNNASFLSCLPVGGPDTPPRRPGAISPGIAMPLDEAPLDVAFADDVRPDPLPDTPAPLTLTGTFAYVTTTRGNIYIVNVDDDYYPDFEKPNDPAAVSLPLALPHQIRDAGSQREKVADTCGTPSVDGATGGPRAAAAPLPPTTSRIATEKLHLMPSVRQVECSVTGTDENDEPFTEAAPVSQLVFNAPVAMRELTFPDWRTARNEDWSIVYEGLLSLDDFLDQVDGQPVRSGVVTAPFYDSANRYVDMFLKDPGEAFCQLGVEPFDTVQLLGCDPAVGDAQCRLGETCYVHPDSPAAVTSGVCLPSGDTDRLSSLCREFLIARKQYAVSQVYADRLALVPRRRVLGTSPLDGCSSDAQCQGLADLEENLSDPAPPLQATGASPWTWTCGQDPSRPAGPDRCLMTCETSDECEEGNVCLAGYCNEGVPPASDECVQAIQRYQVRATDAFVAIGSVTGYLHHQIQTDTTTKACGPDPTANPLLVGRIPLRPPPCVGDGMTDISPNPCSFGPAVPGSIAVDQIEDVTRSILDGDQCTAQDEEVTRSTSGETVDQQVSGVRFQNPAFRLDLVDTETRGDRYCNGDRLGALDADGKTEVPPFSAVYPGFEIKFTITGGLLNLAEGLAVIATFPSRVVRAPDGRIWLVDSGDQSGSAGRLYRVTPSDNSVIPNPIL